MLALCRQLTFHFFKFPAQATRHPADRLRHRRVMAHPKSYFLVCLLLFVAALVRARHLSFSICSLSDPPGPLTSVPEAVTRAGASTLRRAWEAKSEISNLGSRLSVLSVLSVLSSLPPFASVKSFPSAPQPPRQHQLLRRTFRQFFQRCGEKMLGKFLQNSFDTFRNSSYSK